MILRGKTKRRAIGIGYRVYFGRGLVFLWGGLAIFADNRFDNATAFDAGGTSSDALWATINDSSYFLDIGVTDFFATAVGVADLHQDEATFSTDITTLRHDFVPYS